MSVLINTGVFVAVQNERDEHHNAATRAFTAAFDGEFGALYTNDYVYDEAVTLARMRKQGAMMKPDALAIGSQAAVRFRQESSCCLSLPIGSIERFVYSNDMMITNSVSLMRVSSRLSKTKVSMPC